MPDRFLVSIIMNCYNGEKFLRESIDSVLSQTYKYWELIFWDNQSVDDSASIVNSYSDRRIRYFYAENHTNLGEARNQALMKARGEWVGFLDVDDLWFPSKLKKQVDEISKAGKDIGLSYSRCEFFGDTINPGIISRGKKVCPRSGELPQENLASELFVGNLIPFPSVLYKKEALDAIGGVPAYKHPPDYYMSLAISLKWRVIAIGQILCAYRLHQNNLSSRLRESGYRESIDIVRKLAPKNQVHSFESCHRARLLMYLILRQRWGDVRQEFSILGFKGLLFGITAILRFKIKYSCSLY